MRKILTAITIMMSVAGCATHDPILPGDRTAIFDTANIKILNQPIPNAPKNAGAADAGDCPYTQDASNVIWHGDKKIFSGFPTSNMVGGERHPVCSGAFLYVGLTTGEVVKINAKTHQVAWVADVYRPSNMTGGSSVLDIVAPVVVAGDAVYAGGLGDAVCRMNAASGAKTWCTDIGTGVPMLVVDNVVYVTATDGNLYAMNAKNGDVYWRQPVRAQETPILANGIVRVGRQCMNASTGDGTPCD